MSSHSPPPLSAVEALTQLKHEREQMAGRFEQVMLRVEQQARTQAGRMGVRVSVQDASGSRAPLEGEGDVTLTAPADEVHSEAVRSLRAQFEQQLHHYDTRIQQLEQAVMEADPRYKPAATAAAYSRRPSMQQSPQQHPMFTSHRVPAANHAYTPAAAAHLRFDETYNQAAAAPSSDATAAASPSSANDDASPAPQQPPPQPQHHQSLESHLSSLSASLSVPPSCSAVSLLDAPSFEHALPASLLPRWIELKSHVARGIERRDTELARALEARTQQVEEELMRQFKELAGQVQEAAQRDRQHREQMGQLQSELAEAHERLAAYEAAIRERDALTSEQRHQQHQQQQQQQESSLQGSGTTHHPDGSVDVHASPMQRPSHLPPRGSYSARPSPLPPTHPLSSQLPHSSASVGALSPSPPSPPSSPPRSLHVVELAERDEHITTLQSQLAEREQRIRTLQDELLQRSTAEGVHATAMDDATQATQKAQTAQEKAEAVLMQSEARCRELEEHITQLEGQITKLEGQITKLEAQVALQDEHAAQATRDLAHLQQQVQQQSIQCATQESLVHVQQEMIGRLQERTQQLEQLAAEEQRRAEQAEAQVSSLHSSLTHTQSDLSRAEKQLAPLQEARGLFDQAVQAMESQLHEAQSEVLRLTDARVVDARTMQHNLERTSQKWRARLQAQREQAEADIKAAEQRGRDAAFNIPIPSPASLKLSPSPVHTLHAATATDAVRKGAATSSDRPTAPSSRSQRADEALAQQLSELKQLRDALTQDPVMRAHAAVVPPPAKPIASALPSRYTPLTTHATSQPPSASFMRSLSPPRARSAAPLAAGHLRDPIRAVLHDEHEQDMPKIGGSLVSTSQLTSGELEEATSSSGVHVISAHTIPASLVQTTITPLRQARAAAGRMAHAH